MAVISNTTLISNFAGIGRLDLLKLCWGNLYIPEQVYAEIQEGRLQGYAFYDNIEQVIAPFSPSGWLELTALHTTEEFKTFGNLMGNLHHGEAACLALAVHRGWLFLTDDRAARVAARRLNLPVSGTLGVLLSLHRRDLISREMGDQVLSEMLIRGYYAPVHSLTELL